MEEYKRIKFITKFLLRKAPNNEKIPRLKYWCSKFHKHNLAPSSKGGSLGNLSFRTKNGFVIIASGLRLKENLTDDAFVEVISCDIKSKILSVIGKKQPSSESFMHHLIYNKRKDVNAIFHGHDKKILNTSEKLRILVTEREQEPGTVELAEEVSRLLENNFIVIKNHGFVSLGNTMDEAGNIALRMHKKVLNL